MSSKDVPLGKILHIVENEAIVRPEKTISAKGARVVTIENIYVGKLGDPFGPVDHPYLPIRLQKDTNEEDVIGKLAIAQIRPKQKKSRYKKKKYRSKKNY